MGLYEDVKGAQDLWRTSTIYTKCALALSAFLALGSVATISDVVFQWKGFVKDGIDFYNLTIPYIFQKATEFFGGTLSDKWVNYYVLAGLMVGGQIRLTYLKKDDSNLKLHIAGVIILGLVFFGGLVYRAMYTVEMFGFEMITLLIAYIGPPLLFRWSGRFRFIYFSPAIFAICGVLFLGAINSGLTRTT